MYANSISQYQSKPSIARTVFVESCSFVCVKDEMVLRLKGIAFIWLPLNTQNAAKEVKSFHGHRYLTGTYVFY